MEADTTEEGDKGKESDVENNVGDDKHVDVKTNDDTRKVVDVNEHAQDEIRQPETKVCQTLVVNLLLFFYWLKHVT